MTDLTVTVKVKSSRKMIDPTALLAWLDRRAVGILDTGAWLNPEGEPVIPNVLDETYLQALHDVRVAIESGNFAG